MKLRFTRPRHIDGSIYGKVRHRIMFFCGMIDKIIRYIQININQLKSLQVRSECSARRRICFGASVTVEAAIALPLVIFSLAVLITPMYIMDADRRMQGSCEGICASVCRYAYTVNEQTKGKTAGGDEGIGETLAGLAESGALGAYAMHKAGEAVKDSGVTIVDFIGTDMMTEDDIVTIRLRYTYKFPFPVLGLDQLSKTVVSSRRAWVGSDGTPTHEGTQAKDKEDPWVYVGRNGSVYHISRSCSYFVHSFSAASTSSLSRYKPCDRCVKGQAKGTVYVSDGGQHYHTSPSCSSLNSYIKAVRMSEVKGLGVCSRCGRKHGGS